MKITKNRVRKIRIRGSVGACLSALLIQVGCREKSSDRAVAQTNGAPQASQSDSASQSAGVANLEIVSETEKKERDNFEERVRSLFSEGDFAQLEALAKGFRETKAKFRNGYWKLRAFYLAFGELPDNATEANWRELIKQANRWATTYPKSVTARIALAEIYQSYAWQARTSEAADKVTEEGWKLMAGRLNLALKALREAKALPEKCPGWYGASIHVALGRNLERQDYESLFEEAVKAVPDYAAIYEYKAYYLLPRWYGKEKEWESFAAEMSKRSDIPYSREIFARAALYLRGLGYFYDEFSGDKESWSLLKQSFREIEKNYPDSLEIRSRFCLICIKLGDFEEGRTQLNLLNNKVDISVWETLDNYQNAISVLKSSERGPKR
ncbi:MAG: hypothetical protein QOJ40_604 [Verrucomicrobiota bacterium]